MILKTNETLFNLNNYSRIYIDEMMGDTFAVVASKSGVNTIDTIAKFPEKTHALDVINLIAEKWSDNRVHMFDLDKHIAKISKERGKKPCLRNQLSY